MSSLIKQSISISERDRDFLKEISMSSSKYKGKVSTGIKILINVYRSILKEAAGPEEKPELQTTDKGQNSVE
jgi:hypothetical protein